MWLIFSISVSIPLITRCVILGTSLCLSGFLFPICKMGPLMGLTSHGYLHADAWPWPPTCRYYLPSYFFPHTKPDGTGWGW